MYPKNNEKILLINFLVKLYTQIVCWDYIKFVLATIQSYRYEKRFFFVMLYLRALQNFIEVLLEILQVILINWCGGSTADVLTNWSGKELIFL